VANQGGEVTKVLWVHVDSKNARPSTFPGDEPEWVELVPQQEDAKPPLEHSEPFTPEQQARASASDNRPPFMDGDKKDSTAGE